jgi:ribonuclease H / adenosylcobalamin/alpha-ribazole phosphatase
MREKEPSTRIIYVRHGETDFPSRRIYCDDREDPPLNNEGVTQAQDAGELLQLQSVDAIYTSPSSRTRMTADQISRTAKIPNVITEDRALSERRFGIWEGLFFDEISQKYAEGYQLWRQDPIHYTPAGGETIDELLTRVNSAIQRIIEAHFGKTIVVVSHVGPIRVALTAALRVPVQWYRQLRIDYGSLTRVDYGSSQNNLIYSNIIKSLNYYK